ncbi:hypothetical protein RN001_011323 [Aquatica leii]|uniref:Uncharacterized protein n=1 Tax=Aquatica leii TaxID=1421715 RepID=A0AAN7P7S0_9COLE|nr:hypothetical protein RN001_011323 [Aquatica leii]
MVNTKQIDLNASAVENFKQYLRIVSEVPNFNYELCVVFLAKLAKDLELLFNIFRINPNRPSVVLTWLGTTPHLESVMLNCRMDAKELGTPCEDIKTHCAGIQYLEVIRRLKHKGFKPKRTVHVGFLSGTNNFEQTKVESTKEFTKSSQFKLLNVGFVIDEGIPSEDDVLTAYCDNKRCWRFAIHCFGTYGDAALPLEDTAGQKVQFLLNKFYQFRNDQKEAQHKVQGCEDFITVNLTMMKGGTHISRIPKKLTLSFDTRCPLDKFDKFSNLVSTWCSEAGDDVEIENFVKEVGEHYATLKNTNPFWMALKASVEKMKIKLKIRTTSNQIDSSKFRAVGIPTVSFSPNRKVPKSTSDESLNIKVFLEGIAVLEEVIAAVVSV